MPIKNQLLVLASLAACEHIDSVKPQPTAGLPEDPAPPVARETARESAPDAGVEALLVRPGVALKPRRPPMTWDTAELDRRCGLRAGCRWEGEDERPRVTRKSTVLTLPATTK